MKWNICLPTTLRRWHLREVVSVPSRPVASSLCSTLLVVPRLQSNRSQSAVAVQLAQVYSLLASLKECRSAVLFPGAKLAIADIDGAAATETAGAIAAAGGQAAALVADVLSEDSMRTALEAAEADLGEIDIVMNNAGSIVNGYPQDIPLAEWQRLMDLDFFSVVRSNAIFLPKMLARNSGHIVNTASVAGLFPFADSRMPYAARRTSA